MPNSAMNHLLSGGMNNNNNNNNQQFDQRDSEPKTDFYTENMKAAEKEVTQKGTGEDSVRLLKNSLGNIELSCKMLLSRNDTLENIVTKLEKVRKKMDFQREKEKIERILNEITAWLDRYGGNNDEVDEIRSEIAKCNWALSGREKWRDEWKHKENWREADVWWQEIREYLRTMEDTGDSDDYWQLFRDLNYYQFYKYKSYYQEEYANDLIDFMSKRLVPFFQSHGNNEKIIELCERVVAFVLTIKEEDEERNGPYDSWRLNISGKSPDHPWEL